MGECVLIIVLQLKHQAMFILWYFYDISDVISESGPVHDLVAMPMSTSLTVSWAAPGHSNGAILYYVVRYRQQQIGSCLAEHMSWTPKVDVDPDETSYLIQALSPYSVYGIRVWAHTAAGKGQFTTISVTTQAAGMANRILSAVWMYTGKLWFTLQHNHQVLRRKGRDFLCENCSLKI